MIKLENHNLKYDDCLEVISSAGIKKYENQWEVKAIYRRRPETEWFLYAAQISPASDPQEIVRDIYPEEAFFTVYIKDVLAEDLFTRLIEGIAVTPNFPPIQVSSKKVWDATLIPSHASQFDHPARHLSLRIDCSNFGDKQLMGYGVPFHRSFEEATKKFIETRNGDRSAIHFIFENIRGRLTISNGFSNVEAASAEVSGEIICNNNALIVTEDTISSIDLTKASSVEIWLIGEGNHLIDCISSSSYPYKYSIEPQQVEFPEKIKCFIKSGESTNCEFKKYLDLTKKSDKLIDIERTVCAFSNTQGGFLIIGVNDLGETLGIDVDVRKSYGSNTPEALVKYSNDIKKRLYENLTDSDCFQIEITEVFEHTLAVIEVRKTKGWNTLSNSEVAYERRGATNVNATRKIALQLDAPKDVFL